MSSGLEMQLLDINNRGAQAMSLALEDIRAAAAKDPRIASVSSLYEGAIPQYTLKVDRDMVKLRGLTLESVYSALSAFMGGSYVNDFVEFGRVFWAILQKFKEKHLDKFFHGNSGLSSGQSNGV